MFIGLEQEKRQFKKKLTDYMIEHAYEIHEWQMELNAGPRLVAYADARLAQQNAEAANHALDDAVPPSQQTGKMKERISPRTHEIADEINAERQNPGDSLERIDRRDQRQVDNNDRTVSERKKVFTDVMKEHEAEIQQTSTIVCEHFVKNVKKFIIDSRNEWKVGRIGGKEITINIDGHEQRITVPKNVYKIFQFCQKAESDHNWKTHFNEIAQIGLDASRPHRFDFFGLTKRDALTQQFYDKFKQSYIEKDAEIVRHRARG
jgi:hypothetical protein